MAKLESDGAAAAYKRFRGSKGFLVGLCTFIAVWIAFHYATGFDPDWANLVNILSIEASLNMGVFMMVADRQEAFQRKQMEYMLHLLEAQHALIAALAPKRADASPDEHQR